MSPATVIASLALVFATAGGAFAASKYVISSTKQIKPSVLAQLRGKAGLAGANGAQGPQGPAGPAGKEGAKGANGSNGASVASVESKTKIGPCKEGGSEFKAGSSTTYACNGEKGKEGEEGSPWTAGGTLPKGATETGTWLVRGTDSAEGELRITTISFPIPLKSPLKDNTDASFIKIHEVARSGHCTGNVEKPGAEPGNLCVFAGESLAHVGGLVEEPAPAFVTPAGGGVGGFGAETTGTELAFETKKPTTPGEEVSAEGTWAVTAE